MNSRVNGSTRRQAIAGAAIIAVAAAVRPAQAWAGVEEISHTAESIHQEAHFQASRQRVFEALTDARQFHKVIQLGSGMDTQSLGKEPTVISHELGGSFSIFGGHIIGRQIELVSNQRIVQGWRVVDWAPGIYSIARFELAEQGSGTKLVFDHTGFPQGQGQHLAAGWRSHYWEPLQKFLAGSR